jgi:hypothetical protein
MRPTRDVMIARLVEELGRVVSGLQRAEQTAGEQDGEYENGARPSWRRVGEEGTHPSRDTAPVKALDDTVER